MYQCKVFDREGLILEFNYTELVYTSFYRILFFCKEKEYFKFPAYKAYRLEIFEDGVLFKEVPIVYFFVFKLYRGGRIFSFFTTREFWEDNNDSRIVVEWEPGVGVSGG